MVSSPKRKRAVRATAKIEDGDPEVATPVSSKLSISLVDAWKAWVANGPQGPIDDAT